MTETRTLRIDPHVHSVASYDGLTPVPKLLERASEAGLDAVVVTDHDRIEASLVAADLAPDYGLIGIPGVEVSTADGHLLALGVRERPAPGRSLPATVARVRAAGGVAVVPHPFQRVRHGVRRRDLTDCDAVEVYNACSLTGYRNRQAAAFAEAADYPAVAGSDAHGAADVGRAYTAVRVPADAVDASDRRDPVASEAILDALRRG